MRLSEPEAGPEGKEGSGEIFRTMLLVNYELLSKYRKWGNLLIFSPNLVNSYQNQNTS
jgi:hypothetical protein